MTINTTMQTQERCCWSCRGTVEETQVTLGQEWRTSVGPQGRMLVPEVDRSQESQFPNKVMLDWWYWGWRSKWTHCLTVTGAGAGAAIALLVWRRHCLDQGLARDSLEDNATALTFVSYTKLKCGVLEIFKTRDFNKEGFAGKITSRAAECIDKI